MSSASQIQRLQRLYLRLHRDPRSLLGDCCVGVDLIDEDDLRNWYVLLRYEDENRTEFFLSLRLYFMDALERMPFVFVIAPRLAASFIHYGAICSLELMSQRWAVDAEGLALLLQSLHVTLNPFGGECKVANDEREAANAFSCAEHELGIQYIKQAHPHLFRGFTKRTHAEKARGEREAAGRRGEKEEREEEEEREREREKEKEEEKALSDANGSVTKFAAAEAETEAAVKNSVNAQRGGAEDKAEGTAKHSASRTVRSRAELEKVFTEGQKVTVRLQLCRSGTDENKNDEDDNNNNNNNNNNDDDVDNVDDDDDHDYSGSENRSVVYCTLPSRVPSGPYTVHVRPCTNTSASGCEEDSRDSEYEDSRNDSENDSVTSDGDAYCSAEIREIAGDENVDARGNDLGPQESYAARRNWMQRRVTKHRRVRKVRTTSEREDDNAANAQKKSMSARGGAIVFTGALSAASTETDMAAAARENVFGTAPCVIPAGCTLRLHNLTIYADVTVLGVLELHHCTFVGCISTEGTGRALVRKSDVYVDVPESRREGILVLDASSVVMREHTVVRRKEYAADGEHVERAVLANTASLLQSLIVVSNNGSLSMEHDCSVVSYATEKTIFAEQNASVFMSDCRVMAGHSSALSIQGCRAFLANTHFYGGERITLQVSDANRPTGLNVELGGFVTAHHCQAVHLYFGFSVIVHSVAHFLGCHAENVVNGYTIDASSVTMENSSASTNHVGVYAVNKAKCTITNDLGVSYGECCREVLRLRKKPQQPQRTHIGAMSFTGPFGAGERAESDAAAKNATNFRRAHFEGPIDVHSHANAEHHDNRKHSNDNSAANHSAKDFDGPSDRLSSPSHPSATDSLSLPLSFSGGLFSFEVRDATIEAKGVLLTDAQEASLYVYDQGSLELSNAVLWTNLTTAKHPCAVKVMGGFAYVQRCLAVDYVFGFAAIQGANVQFDACAAVGGTNGFTIDAARGVLRHCAADTEHVGVFSLNQSNLRMDNSDAPKIMAGGVPCVLKGRVYGLESRNSETVCVGVTVQRGLDSGFTCYNKGYLRLDRCVVDMSTADAAEGNTRTQSQSLHMFHPREERGQIHHHHHHPHHHQQQQQLQQQQQQLSLNNYTEVLDVCDNNHALSFGATSVSAGSVASHFISAAPPPVHEYAQKNSGVKAWSGSHCVMFGCEVQHVTFGYAAIGPETTLEASHCTAKHIVNGFTVDSAKCRLSRCSTSSNHVGVFVLRHGTCTVRRGSYIARVYGIENRNGIVYIKGHVKIGGFSRIGMYVYGDARLDTEAESLLDIRVHKGSPLDMLPPPAATSEISTKTSDIFPSCFAMDKGNAVLHNAVFSGGAQCAVSCGDGADVYFHKCIAKYCNIAFHVMGGSQIYLSDCEAHHVWQHALFVRRGGMLRVSSHSPDVFARGGFHGKLRIDGTCFLERVSLRPAVFWPQSPVSAEEEEEEEEGEERGKDKEEATNTTAAAERKMSDGKSSPLRVDAVSSSDNSSNSNDGDEHDNHCSKAEKHNSAIYSSSSSSNNMHNPMDDDNNNNNNNDIIAPTTGLIRVSGSGALVMDWCSILLDAPFLSADSPTCAVIFAENRKTNVWLRGVAFVGYGDAAKAQSFSPFFGLALQRGAKGEVQGAVAPAIPQESPNTNTNINNHSDHHSNHHSGHNNDNDNNVSVHDNDSGGGVCDVMSLGSAFAFSGDSLFLRVHVDRSSQLTATNIRVRQIIAAGSSTVHATRCLFTDAVRLCGESQMRAVRCVFVGVVQNINATCALSQCRAFGAAFVCRDAALTLRDCVLTTRGGKSDEMKRREKRGNKKPFGANTREEEQDEEKDKDKEKEPFPRTAAPTCRPTTEANERNAADISHAHTNNFGTRSAQQTNPKEEREQEEEEEEKEEEEEFVADVDEPRHVIALARSELFLCELSRIDGKIAADISSRVKPLRLSGPQKLLRILRAANNEFWHWWNGTRKAQVGEESF